MGNINDMPRHGVHAETFGHYNQRGIYAAIPTQKLLYKNLSCTNLKFFH